MVKEVEKKTGGMLWVVLVYYLVFSFS
jgi:hypothetical protein